MAKVTTTRMLLVRSGPTDWDLAGRVQGAADLPMAPSGEQTVRQMLDAVGPQALAVVYSAPDEASRETARMLATHAAAKVVVVPEFGEMALGLWEGLTYEDLERRFCRAGRLFFDDPCGVTAPEGEALTVYSGRLIPSFAKVLGKCKPASAVGMVVRPIALGLIRCAMNRADLNELWTMVSDRPTFEWYHVQRDDPRLNQPPKQPRRPVAAA